MASLALAVAGLAEDLGGRLRERALVGDGDAQQPLGAVEVVRPNRTSRSPHRSTAPCRCCAIAVPTRARSRSRLRDPARGRLPPAPATPRSSRLTDADNGVEFFYLRPRDIALYVGEGTLDVGITGRDLLLDSGAKAEEVLPLGFGRSAFHFAGPAGTLHRPRRARRHAHRHVVRRRGAPVTSRSAASRPTVTRLDGAVETSIQLGVADVIADVVETGSTLRAAGLEVFGEPILESEAVLITRAGADPARASRCSGAGSRASWSRAAT